MLYRNKYPTIKLLKYITISIITLIHVKIGRFLYSQAHKTLPPVHYSKFQMIVILFIFSVHTCPQCKCGL